jgi:arylsulfatase A-like enzyme
VKAEHSETPYMTRRALDFVDEAGGEPWCLHLSYIKPHWPCIAPAPYHAMYTAADVPPAVRSPDEQRDPHPLYREFMKLRVSRAFSRDEVRAAVIPAYMGLVAQIDDAIGELLEGLRARGLLDSTLIVFTSDHGDYLGDHWLGEKDLFHDPSVKIPLIVVDPSPEADAGRGTVCDALVESIDLAPTFVEFAGGEVPAHILEGRSLRRWLHGRPPSRWREAAISEYDYSMTPAAEALGVAPIDARAFMVRDERYKLVHAEGMRPMLFDLAADPHELVDLGADPAYAAQSERLFGQLNRWARRQSQRTTVSDAQIEARRGGSERKGVLIGYWDEAELPAEVLPEKWRGAPARRGGPA